MFGKMKCRQCGTILGVEVALKSSGNVFCSDNCANVYKKTSEDRHGCC